MFFGDSVANTIQRLTNTESYRILYRPHGSCMDHFIRHLVSNHCEKFFVSNRVVLDKSINLIDNYSLETLLETRLCSRYNFQICSNVSKNLEATITTHLPLVYLVHTKEDLVDIENNLLGKYPYIVLITNQALYELSLKLNLDRDRVFYTPFCVQDNIDEKINRAATKTNDVGVFIGGQKIEQVKGICERIAQKNLNVQIFPNHYSSEDLINIFETTKVIVELNAINIYNIIYAINCGTPGIIYNKDHTGDETYIYKNIDDMLSKIEGFLTNKTELPLVGFSDKNKTETKEILANINSRGLII